MMSDICDELISTYQELRSYSEFTLELIRLFSHETAITENELLNGKHDTVADKLFDELGIKRLKESYMRDEETSPQQRFASMAE